MTLVVTAIGPKSIWLLADRRLSSKGRLFRDDARKIMFLETDDGVAILAYAGLGATPQGTEPSDWMSAVLRGRRLALEECLGVLAQAMKKQLPKHMIKIPGDSGPAHNVIVPAFLGNEPRLYTIDLVFGSDRKNYRFRYTRHVANPSPGVTTTPPLGLGGTGAQYLMKDKIWARNLLRVVRAGDRGRVSPRTVADRFAELNHEVHLGVNDNSVGPRCIVARRFPKGGGGDHLCYNATAREASTPSLPTIANGMDVAAIASVLVPNVASMWQAMRAGTPQTGPDEDELNAGLARLPRKPDEDLR